MKNKRVNAKNKRTYKKNKRSVSKQKPKFILIIVGVILGVVVYGAYRNLSNNSFDSALGEIKFKKIKPIELTGCGETQSGLTKAIATYNSAPNGNLDINWKTDIAMGQKLGSGLYQQGVSTKGTYITQKCQIEKKCSTMNVIDRLPGNVQDWTKREREFRGCSKTEQHKYVIKNTKYMKKIHQASNVIVKACRTTNNPADTVRVTMLAKRSSTNNPGILNGYNALVYLGFDGKIQREYYDKIDKEKDTTRFASVVISSNMDNVSRPIGGINALDDYAMELTKRPKLQYYHMGTHEIRGYYKSVNKGQKNPWVVVGFAGNVTGGRQEFTKKVRFNTLPKCKSSVLLKPDWGIKQSQL